MTLGTYLWEQRRLLATLRLIYGESSSRCWLVEHAIERATKEADRRGERYDFAAMDAADPIESTAE